MNQDKSTIFEKNILLYMEEAENIYQNTEHTMMDKLGERIFFERMSIRLYEGLIRKHRGDVFKSRLPDMNRIKQFHDEEKEHFQLLEKIIKQMGGDPNIMTSAAELIGQEAVPWPQIINDPRTTFLQSLEIILHTELIDNSGWELLIELAERNGLGKIAIRFQQALDEENFHLLTIKQWVQELTLNEEIISPEKRETRPTPIKH
jgi:rubrerythrin